MKTRSLKIQILAVFIVVLSLSMFMLSSVWLLLMKQELIENETIAVKNHTDSLALYFNKADTVVDENELNNFFLQLATDNGLSCYKLELGEILISYPGNVGCKFLEDNENTGERELQGENTKSIYNITYSGTTWATLTFSSKYLHVTRVLFLNDSDYAGSITVKKSLEPVYQKLRAYWKIVIFYIMINAIIFTSIGFFRMYRLVLKPLDRLLHLSEKCASGTDLIFHSGESNNEFSQLSLGLNRMVGRIQEDNKTLSATVTALEEANQELKRNEKEMLRTEKLASVGRLSAGLAHEIGNPLGIVQGYVDMLGTLDLQKEEKKQFSNRANDELKRIDALIRQLLDMSRMVERAGSTIKIQKVLLNLLDFFSLQKRDFEIQVKTEFRADDDRVAVHEDQLRQVFLNCLMNATDAIGEVSEEREGEIVIICENLEVEQEKHIQIRIIDNGPGVAPALLNNLFDPFFTTKETGKGTGLGLYVSHTIMENLGGKVTFNNLEPFGAEIVIQLPCLLQSDDIAS
ncbi:MAG: HAMP domain-containing histidine kinase [Desulfobulbaceae bacterium]|nr:HAMP domain-containing histidine kinase [Desulfobulbaceae bacterium]